MPRVVTLIIILSLAGAAIYAKHHDGDRSVTAPTAGSAPMAQIKRDVDQLCQSGKVTCENGMVYFKPDKKELHQMLDDKLSESDVELGPSELEAAHELLDRELQD
jgi:hypothetical protein